MFESLQERLGSILNGLTGRGALSEKPMSRPRCARCAGR